MDQQGGVEIGVPTTVQKLEANDAVPCEICEGKQPGTAVAPWNQPHCCCGCDRTVCAACSVRCSCCDEILCSDCCEQVGTSEGDCVVCETCRVTNFELCEQCDTLYKTHYPDFEHECE